MICNMHLWVVMYCLPLKKQHHVYLDFSLLPNLQNTSKMALKTSPVFTHILCLNKLAPVSKQGHRKFLELWYTMPTTFSNLFNQNYNDLISPNILSNSVNSYYTMRSYFEWPYTKARG